MITGVPKNENIQPRQDPGSQADDNRTVCPGNRLFGGLLDCPILRLGRPCAAPNGRSASPERRGVPFSPADRQAGPLGVRPGDEAISFRCAASSGHTVSTRFELSRNHSGLLRQGDRRSELGDQRPPKRHRHTGQPVERVATMSSKPVLRRSPAAMLTPP